MQRSYHILGRSDSRSSRKLAAYLARHGQFLLPWVELIEQSRLAVDELIDVVGRAAIEAVLELSAAQVAGPRRQGRRRRGVGWYGRQRGRVRLKERKLAVHRPRLRRPGRGAGKEVPLPAYEAMQEGEGLGARMLDILLRGVSTRQYQRVLPEMAGTVGVSRSTVSRETMEAAAAELERLLNRRFEEVELLILYIDGMVFGDHHVIAAVGVDAEGHKHVLGIQEGATENAAAVQDLLEGLVRRGVQPAQKRLFCDRRLEGLAGGDPRRVRGRAAGAALPRPQVAQRPGPVAGARAGPGAGGDAGRLAVGSEDRQGQAGEVGPMVGARLSGRGGQLAGGSGGMFHHQPAGASGFAASLSGHHQSHRESAGGSEVANSPGVPLAGCGHGPALDRLQLPGHGEKLPPPDGVPGPVDVESDPRRIKVGHSTGGGVV